MAVPEMNPPPRLSAFFERKRRLAYYFAWASMLALVLQLWLGFLLEFYSHPRAAVADGGAFRVIHRSINQDEPERSTLLLLDPDAKPQAPALSLPDVASDLLTDDGDVTVFFGSHATAFTDGKISRSLDLRQKWDVLAAAGDWIFGWTEDKIVARHRNKDTWEPEVTVAKSADVERIVASREAAAGTIVAWRERNHGKVRTARFDGTAFAAGPDFEIGAAEHWDAVATGGRTLLIVYNRDDRSIPYVTLRLECCPGCASPLALRKVRFSEPALLVGRKVTGLTGVVAGTRLRLFITRMSTLMTATLPLPSLEPDPETPKLKTIVSQAPWRHVIGAFSPALLFFCSFAMISLGYMLFRERGRIARGEVQVGPNFANFFQRVMAYVLDHILLAPFMYFGVELLNIGSEGGMLETDDPGLIRTAAFVLGAYFLYYFLMEWRLGWTVGKLILGLKVTGADGSRLSFRGALIRSLVRLVDAEMLFLNLVGCALILSTKRRQRLGDVLARTVVIQDLPE
jgi:uncharacterized RDD family membrane protein YckC